MKGEIAAARTRWEGRVKAAHEGGLTGDDAVLAMLSGFDLDGEEFREAATEATMSRVGPMAFGGAGPVGVVGSAFAEGFAVGLMVAEGRAKGGDS